MFFEESACDRDLREFFQHKSQRLLKAPRVPDLNLTQHFQWSDDESRVIVSIALSCDMPCKFCYVQSVREGEEFKTTDRDLLGSVLGASLAFDTRLGRDTIIFLGGMSDPMLGSNAQATLSFVKALRGVGLENKIHIATRAKLGEVGVTPDLINDTKIIFGVSASVLSNGIEAAEVEIRKRIESAGKAMRMGGRVTLYVRPVIPGRSLSDAPALADLAREMGIEAVVVGGLYADSSIGDRLLSSGIQIPDKSVKSHLIMDRESKLTKVLNDEQNTIITLFRDRGFEIYDSAFDIANRRVI